MTTAGRLHDEDARWADGLWRAAIAPEPRLSVSEWADQHRVLPPTSAEPGPWRTSRVPYAREIMDCLSPASPFERVAFMKGSQIAGTEIGLNWVGYSIHHAPGMMLMVYPSLDAVRRNTVTRIDPLIETSPVLRDLVVKPRSRDPGNSAFRKAFPGGQIVMTGANSAVGLRSLPARYLFLDEIDAFPVSADEEGDPVALAIQRTVTFRGRRKIFLVSTPTLKGHSRIETAYEESDRRVYEVPCRECGAFSTIMWRDIHWPEGRRQDAFWSCPECGGVHAEHHKPELLASGRWRATADGDGRTAGFHLSSLYSPFEPWSDIAIEHGVVCRDPYRLQAWTNNKLGETWHDQSGEMIEPDPLMARREAWGDELPDGVAVITAGVDVQLDRLEVHVCGWGMDEECWSLVYRVIPGDPTAARLWQDLDRALEQEFPHRRALPDLKIRAVAIDTGGSATQAAYRYVQSRFAARRWGIKGRGGPGIPLWPRRPTKTRNGAPLFLVGVDDGKDRLFQRLKIAEPGPGCLHFPMDRDRMFFDQLTAEKVITKYHMGRPVRTWVPKSQSARNEALDTWVYSLAALHGLIASGFSLNKEAQLVAATEPKGPAMGSTVSTPSRPTVIRSSFMEF